MSHLARNFTKVWHSSINARFVSQASLFMSQLVGQLLFDVTPEIYYRGLVNAVRYRIVYSSLLGFRGISSFWKIPKNSRRRGFILEFISIHLLYWNCTRYKFIMRENIYILYLKWVYRQITANIYQWRKRILFHLNLSKFLI